MSLKKSYVALAWTRPVPWAGFNQLSSDIDAAAMQSRTIRYQRDLIRQYVREVQGVLEKEVALLELAPDRSTVRLFWRPWWDRKICHDRRRQIC